MEFTLPGRRASRCILSSEHRHYHPHTVPQDHQAHGFGKPLRGETLSRRGSDNPTHSVSSSQGPPYRQRRFSSAADNFGFGSSLDTAPWALRLRQPLRDLDLVRRLSSNNNLLHNGCCAIKVKHQDLKHCLNDASAARERERGLFDLEKHETWAGRLRVQVRDRPHRRPVPSQWPRRCRIGTMVKQDQNRAVSSKRPRPARAWVWTGVLGVFAVVPAKAGPINSRGVVVPRADQSRLNRACPKHFDVGELDSSHGSALASSAKRGHSCVRTRVNGERLNSRVPTIARHSTRWAAVLALVSAHR